MSAELIKIQNALNTIAFALQVIAEEVNKLIAENKTLKKKIEELENAIQKQEQHEESTPR